MKAAWTRLDILLFLLPMTLALVLVGQRLIENARLDAGAELVSSHVYSVAKAVNNYRDNTGRWFPETETSNVRVYLDPFHTSGAAYQGLEDEWLLRENNFGMVIQLVSFDGRMDMIVGEHLFEVPFKENDPYIRVLLDYGEQSQTETAILMRLQDHLPTGSLAEVDDHYYVLDLRRLIYAE